MHIAARGRRGPPCRGPAATRGHLPCPDRVPPVASIAEVKAQIEAAKQSAQQSMRALQALNSQLDQAIQQISAAAQGTQHPKVQQSLQALQQAKQKTGEVQASIAGGVRSATEYQQSL